ncbi:MAG: HAMP domain-containing sensor histidine kinase [Lachnospiraceae bacterium]
MNGRKGICLLLKIGFFIVSVAFVAEIIVLPKIEHDMLKEAGRQELVTVQQICGAILENNPQMEQDFILGLCQPTAHWRKIGENILNQYGYDEEHLLADNTLYASYLIAWRNWTAFFLITIFLFLSLAFLFVYMNIRNHNQKILGILEQYLSENFSFSFNTKKASKASAGFMLTQVEERLKQLGHQIETKNVRINHEKESTTALVTDISHQLKTPMAALKTCFYMYLDAANPDEQAEFLQRSETQLVKLEKLISSLMNISRLEAAMISLVVQPVFLNDLLVNAVNGVYEKARKKNIEISLQETENISLQLDEHWTSEAIVNVLDNAVKYSPDSSHIIISVHKQHFYTSVEITDEGIGVAVNEYNKIFQRFYRSHNPVVKETEGSGVGLYLTRMILERQGGTISVNSISGKGSTFILQFRN